ncbi:MAG TPA: disulfide bond formation protein B [Pseudomonadales bacterium]|nr:disulfide bond formation protein B [Pseudomonadales bacterium]
MNDPLNRALLALLLAGAMVGGAQFMEHVLAQDPCPLCLMQRLWTMLAGAFVLGGLAHNPRLVAYPLAALLCTIAGAGFSVRQLWLQHLPADQVPACTPDMAYMIDAFPLADIVHAMTYGTGNCAKVTWTLLGLSIAGWALLGFVALAVSLALWLVSLRDMSAARAAA